MVLQNGRPEKWGVEVICMVLSGWWHQLFKGELRALWVGVLVAVPSGAGVALSVLGGNAGSLVNILPLALQSSSIFHLARWGWQFLHPSSLRPWMPASFGRSPSLLLQPGGPLACTDQRSFFIRTQPPVMSVKTGGHSFSLSPILFVNFMMKYDHQEGTPKKRTNKERFFGKTSQVLDPHLWEPLPSDSWGPEWQSLWPDN